MFDNGNIIHPTSCVIYIHSFYHNIDDFYILHLPQIWIFLDKSNAMCKQDNYLQRARKLNCYYLASYFNDCVKSVVIADYAKKIIMIRNNVEEDVL